MYFKHERVQRCKDGLVRSLLSTELPLKRRSYTRHGDLGVL